MISISAEDKIDHDYLTALGVLRPVDPKRLHTAGSVIFFCGKCRQSLRLLREIRRLTRKRFPRFHSIAITGGPLRLHPKFSGNRRGAGDHAFCLREIEKHLYRDGEPDTTLKAIKLITFAPCETITEANLRLGQALTLLIPVKKLVEAKASAILPKIEVGCFLHTTDHGEVIISHVGTSLFEQILGASARLRPEP